MKTKYDKALELLNKHWSIAYDAAINGESRIKDRAAVEKEFTELFSGDSVPAIKDLTDLPDTEAPKLQDLLRLVDDLVCTWVDNVSEESCWERIKARKSLESAMCGRITELKSHLDTANAALHATLNQHTQLAVQTEQGLVEYKAAVGHVDANVLEKMAKERPDECFLKGSGILKLIGAIRQLEGEIRTIVVPLVSAKASASVQAARDDVSGEIDELLTACRRAILPLAHAAEGNKIYQAAYEKLDGILDEAWDRRKRDL